MENKGFTLVELILSLCAVLFMLVVAGCVIGLIAYGIFQAVT